MRPRKKVFIIPANEISGSCLGMALELAGFRALRVADVRAIDQELMVAEPAAVLAEIKDPSVLERVVRYVGQERVVAIVDTEREAAETPAGRWVLRETGMMAALRNELRIATAAKRGPKRALPMPIAQVGARFA